MAQRPSPCHRCGTPTTQDRHSAGAWVDQSGSSRCPDGRWHTATPQATGTRPGVIAAIVAAGVAAAIVAVVVVFVFVLGSSGSGSGTDASGNDRAAAAPSTQPTDTVTSGAAAESTPAETPAPTDGTPVQCSSLLDCFPDPAIGPDAMTYLGQEQNWACFSEGESDLKDSPVIETEKCQAVDTESRPFEQEASIGYTTTLAEQDPLVTEFTISTTVTSVGDDQPVTPHDGADLASRVFETGTEALWPDDPDLQQQALDAFAEVHADCAKGEADDVDGAAAVMPLGYEVRCYNVTDISVGVEGGNNVQSHGELIFLSATQGTTQ